ncbi:DUF4157 domain-containing protein [Actinophytocola sp.]|uniref:DUF4157 domain-containing protein n=1 Tax=Actinophytocola sp. TaxID=1872138 RepID=UPI002ED1BBD8
MRFPLHSHESQDKVDGSAQTRSPVRQPDPAAPARQLSGPMSPEQVLALQRSLGNAAAAEMLARERDEARPVQRTSVPDVLRSSGRPLAESVRHEMESRLGADFSTVRVHDDSAAHTAAESVQAHAFTSGSHIVFQRGRYDTASPSGKRMLAHELTHVVQQSSGPVPGTDSGDGLRVSDPSDAFERAAEANAERVMNGPAPLQRDHDAGAAEATSAGVDTGAEHAIQRAVGVEVEDGRWRVTDSEGQTVPKATPLVHRPHFQLQAEYRGEEKSNIEMVTNPPGVVTPDEWQTMRDGMSNLDKELTGHKERGVGTASLVGGEPGYQLTMDEPFATPFLQVTAGVPLAALPALLDQLEAVNATVTTRPPSLKPEALGPETQTALNLDNEPSNELLGFITLLDSYLRAGLGKDDVTFPKGLFPVMARTDFAAMFALLPVVERNAVANNLDEWVRLMAGREDLADPAGAERVLAGWFDDPQDTAPAAEITTTRKDFLEAMVPRDGNPGRDLLTAEGKLAPGEDTIDDDERARRLAAGVRREPRGKVATGHRRPKPEMDDITIPEEPELVQALIADLRELYQGMGQLGRRTDMVQYEDRTAPTEAVVVEIRNPGSAPWLKLMDRIYAAIDAAISTGGKYTSVLTPEQQQRRQAADDLRTAAEARATGPAEADPATTATQEAPRRNLGRRLADTTRRLVDTAKRKFLAGVAKAKAKLTSRV